MTVAPFILCVMRGLAGVGAAVSFIGVMDQISFFFKLVEGDSLDVGFVELTCPTNGVEGVLCFQSKWLNLWKGDRFPDRCGLTKYSIKT